MSTHQNETSTQAASARGTVELQPGYVLNEAGEAVPDYENTFIDFFDEGSLIQGTVVRVDRDEVLVDIGFKSEGVIPNRELSTVRKGAKASADLTVGDAIEVYVLEKEDKDGRLILSKRKADYEKAWRRITELAEGEGKVTGQVVEAVKGGLILDIGLKGFLPASLIDFKKSKDLDQFIGQDFECKILEMDRNRNNIVLSRKAILESERRVDREATLAAYKVGDKVKGKVSSIVNFGAFVDLGNIDGLVHISELSHDHVSDPAEVLTVGEDVEVEIIDIDRPKQRISLSRKKLIPDPWLGRVEGLSAGSDVSGKVTRVMPFGALVEIRDGVEALIHISEFTAATNENMNKFARIGDEISAKVSEIDPNKRRIALTFRGTDRELKRETERSANTTIDTTEISAAVSDVDLDGEAATAKGRLKMRRAKAKETTETDDATEDAPAAEEQLSASASETDESVNAMSDGPAAEQIDAVQEPGSLENILESMKEEHNRD